MSGVTVSTVQRAHIVLGRGATVLDLIQALAENLGGEWDDARLSVLLPGSAMPAESGFTLMATMDTGEEPAREPRWETDNGEHVAVWNADKQQRQCNCGYSGDANDVAEHLRSMAGGQ